jgi:SOUL heme-binding protein
MTLRKWRLRLGGVAVGAIALWMVGSLAIVAGVEEAKYSVIATRGDYELRRYEASIVAQTAMPTMSTQDRGRAFRAIAGYIFGGNERQQSIGMTGPVVIDATPASEKIAMTAPVLMDGGTMRFVMPGKYKTLSDLPKPKDSRVTLVELPQRTVAALTFSWYATADRVAAKSGQLQALIARDGLKTRSAPYLASYNPPFSVPFLKRHDVLIDVEPPA